MDVFAGIFELLIYGASALGRLISWVIFSPRIAAWPAAVLLTAGLAVLGYRLHPPHPGGGIVLLIAALAMMPVRLYLTWLQKPRPPARTVQRG